MAEKDMTEKALEAFNDVFADIVNNLLFQGRKRILEEDLEQGWEHSVYRGEKSLREQERDTSKYWKKHNIRIAYIGLENETDAEDDMPLRVIGYDGAAYRDQIAYQTDETGKRRKTRDRYPVVTLVLYFGYKKHWDKARTLYEALRENMDADLMPFVNDYRISLFEIAWLTDDAGFPDTITDAGKGDEPENMSEALDRIENRGRKLGIAQGISRGIAQGISQGIAQGDIRRAKNVALRLYTRGLPVDDIADVLEADTDTVSSWIQGMAGEDGSPAQK